MAVLVSNGPTTLSTPNGFVKSYGYILPMGSGGIQSFSSTPPIAVPLNFQSSSNCVGIILSLFFQGGAMFDQRNTRGANVWLQQASASTWVNRASASFTRSDLWGSQIYPEGTPLVAKNWNEPIAVTTGSNLWRFTLSQSAGTGQLYCLANTGITSASCHITYTDETASFVSGQDCIVAKDKIIIDQTAFLKGHPTAGQPLFGACGYACRSTASNIGDVAMIEWENPPAAPYTLTLDGILYLSSWAGFRVGTETNPIPSSSKATIHSIVAPSFGTNHGIIALHPGGFEAVGHAIWMYGQDMGVLSSSLNLTASVGIASASVVDNSMFQIGDHISIGKENVVGQGSIVTHSITSLTGSNIISFTPVIAGGNRMPGGTIVRYPVNCGIELTVDNISTNAGQWNISTPAAFTMKNVKSDYVKFNFMSNTYNIGWCDEGEDYYFENITKKGNTTHTYLFSQTAPPVNKNCIYKNIVGYYAGFLSSPVKKSFTVYSPAGVVSKLSTGRHIIDNCKFIHIYTSGFISPAGLANEENITNCSIENFFYYGYWMEGVKLIFENNYAWGQAANTSYAAAYLGNIYSIKSWRNNEFDKVYNAIFLNTGQAQFGEMYDDTFGRLYPSATGDIALNSNCYSQLTINSPTCFAGALTFGGVSLAETTDGTSIAITDENNVVNADRVYRTFENLVRTGDGLMDTTVFDSGSGKFALRMEATNATEQADWSFKVPTGNIQNRDMIVGVWAKINSGSYYSGSGYTMPKLIITYDLTTEKSASAVQSTDWQFLSVPFRPTTTNGQIEVTVATQTSQNGAASYVYWDAFSILYPAGYTLNLGGMDLWSSGFPITPPINTSISALDVWSADPTLFGTATVGDHVYRKLLTNGQYLATR